MPYGSESIFVSGLIGGYPIGAQSIAKAWENKCIDTETARRMLAFCSNAGPSFLFGVLGIVFAKHNISLILWLIQIVSAIILALLIPNKSISTCTASRVTPIGYSKALEISVKTTGVICGWVIIFRVIYSFMNHWILRYIPEEIQILFSGILELSGGCIQLSTCKSEAIAFLMASFLLSFGGLCVFMQTRTVTGKLGTGLYLPGKILHSLISTFISYLLLPIIFPTQAVPSVWLPFLLIACIALCIVYIRKKQ
jgi:hypothetical protein